MSRWSQHKQIPMINTGGIKWFYTNWAKQRIVLQCPEDDCIAPQQPHIQNSQRDTETRIEPYTLTLFGSDVAPQHKTIGFITWPPITPHPPFSGWYHWRRNHIRGLWSEPSSPNTQKEIMFGEYVHTTHPNSIDRNLARAKRINEKRKKEKKWTQQKQAKRHQGTCPLYSFWFSTCPVWRTGAPHD